MARLDLPTSPRTAVFRQLIAILRADPVLSATLKTLLCWEGKPTDAQDLTTGNAPALRVTPANGPDEWRYPEAFAGDLYLNCELLVTGYDADDLFNLWWAIQRAIYPASFAAKTANVAALQAAGSRTGLAEFSMIATVDLPPDSNLQHAMGQIKINILEQLTT
jgi:hypothetical protein